MSPKAESGPSQSRSSELSSAERAEFLDILTPHVDKTVARLEKSPIANELEPYGILIGLMGALRAQNPEEGDLEGIILQKAEILHLRKMVGFEVMSAQIFGGPVEGMDDVWSLVKSEAGREVTTAKRYRSNKPQIPPRYKNAKDDLGELKERLNEQKDERERRSTGLLMESLKKSVAEIKARKQP